MKIFVLVSVAAQAEVMEGKVVRIVDGDTLVLLDASNTQHRVRLSGIDTPERGQPFGRRASQFSKRDDRTNGKNVIATLK